MCETQCKQNSLVLEIRVFLEFGASERFVTKLYNMNKDDQEIQLTLFIQAVEFEHFYCKELTDR